MNRIFQNILIGLFISVFAIFLFPTSSISAAVSPGCYDSNTSTSTDSSCIGKKDKQGNVITANTTNCYLKNGTSWDLTDCTALGIAQTPAGTGASTTQTSSQQQDSKQVCAASGGVFSWIVCPIINMLSGLENTIIGVINSQLSTPPLTLTNGSGPAATISRNLHSVWNNFRFVGNMVLIIAILIIAYSEAVGGSLSDAYTVQKTLPRILLGVILINLSFYIMAGIMDIFNVLGNGIFDLIMVPFRSATNSVGIINFSNHGFIANAAGVSGAAGAILGLLAVGVISAFADAAGLIIIVLLLSFSAALAFLGILITVMIRQGIIVFLLLSSPIAFALYILPNTETYFKKWWGLAIKTFMVYPIIEAIIAIAFVMGWILSQLGTTNGIDKLLAIIATLAPLFLIPYAFKISGGVIGAVYGQVNKALSAPRKMATGYAKKRVGVMAKRGDEKIQRNKLFGATAYNDQSVRGRLNRSLFNARNIGKVGARGLVSKQTRQDRLSRIAGGGSFVTSKQDVETNPELQMLGNNAEDVFSALSANSREEMRRNFRSQYQTQINNGEISEEEVMKRADQYSDAKFGGNGFRGMGVGGFAAYFGPKAAGDKAFSNATEDEISKGIYTDDNDKFTQQITKFAAAAGLQGAQKDNLFMQARAAQGAAGRKDIEKIPAGSYLGAMNRIAEMRASGASAADIATASRTLSVKMQGEAESGVYSQDLLASAPRAVKNIAKTRLAKRQILERAILGQALNQDEIALIGPNNSGRSREEWLVDELQRVDARILASQDVVSSMSGDQQKELQTELLGQNAGITQSESLEVSRFIEGASNDPDAIKGVMTAKGVNIQSLRDNYLAISDAISSASSQSTTLQTQFQNLTNDPNYGPSHPETIKLKQNMDSLTSRISQLDAQRTSLVQQSQRMHEFTIIQVAGMRRSEPGMDEKRREYGSQQEAVQNSSQQTQQLQQTQQPQPPQQSGTTK